MIEILPKLVPLLVINFYVEALGATQSVRYVNKPRGTISHANLSVGDAPFSVTEEARHDDYESGAAPGAAARGSSTVNAVPSEELLVTTMVPPIACTRERAM